MKTIQIGVIGSCSDLKYSKRAELLAVKLGKLIAESNNILIYGAEKDINSLPTIAAKSAKGSGGIAIGVTYEKGLELYEKDAATAVIATGLVRGGGRETSLILSCDVVIALSGGSGTLNEICVAYQANIPVVVIKGFGGWSDKLADTFLDDRRRYRFAKSATADDALALAIASVINER